MFKRRREFPGEILASAPAAVCILAVVFLAASAGAGCNDRGVGSSNTNNHNGTNNNTNSNGTNNNNPYINANFTPTCGNGVVEPPELCDDGNLEDGDGCAAKCTAEGDGWVAVSAGDNHTVAVTRDGTTWGWGWNNSGQLGDGTDTDTLVPTQARGVLGAVAIFTTALTRHTCALMTNSTVMCWGRNVDGELGNGLTTRTYVPVPDVVGGLLGAVGLLTSSGVTCALKGNGTVWCWGDNAYGTLGDGTFIGRLSPVEVSGLSGVRAIAGGSYHNCALKNDGTVWCWGENGRGQLGDPSTHQDCTGTDCSPVPVQVSGLSAAVAITAGVLHGCAVIADGTAWCWGQNEYGQLGNGTTVPQYTPVQVTGLSGVVSISGGFFHTCALKDDGTAWCWGENHGGQLGTGTVAPSQVPVQVNGLSDVVSISASPLAHTCAIKSDHTLWCWGTNRQGQLGDGTTTSSLVPIQILRP